MGTKIGTGKYSLSNSTFCFFQRVSDTLECILLHVWKFKIIIDRQMFFHGTMQSRGHFNSFSLLLNLIIFMNHCDSSPVALHLCRVFKYLVWEWILPAYHILPLHSKDAQKSTIKDDLRLFSGIQFSLNWSIGF